MTNLQPRDIIVASIHPHLAEMIANGTKTFELRKSHMNGKYMAIYATAPVKRIVAIARIVKKHTTFVHDDLWHIVEGKAGIDKDAYYAYFAGCGIGSAFELADVQRINASLADFGLCKAPQSMAYAKVLPIKILATLNKLAGNIT